MYSLATTNGFVAKEHTAERPLAVMEATVIGATRSPLPFANSDVVEAVLDHVCRFTSDSSRSPLRFGYELEARRTLTRLCLTSRAFHVMATRRLYMSISVHDAPSFKRFFFNLNEERQARHRVALIRRLFIGVSWSQLKREGVRRWMFERLLGWLQESGTCVSLGFNPDLTNDTAILKLICRLESVTELLIVDVTPVPGPGEWHLARSVLSIRRPPHLPLQTQRALVRTTRSSAPRPLRPVLRPPAVRFPSDPRAPARPPLPRARPAAVPEFQRRDAQVREGGDADAAGALQR